MPTDFPGAVDAFPNPDPATATLATPIPHSKRHTDANDAIEAIEVFLLDPVSGLATKETPAGAQARVDIEAAARSAADALLIPLTQKGALGGVASLDTVTGKVPAAQLPAIALTDTFVVNSQAAMLALVAQVGDVAVRNDEGKSYILTAEPASTLANWQELLTPTSPVQSVNGRTGAVTGLAEDTAVLHRSGDETAAGAKVFSGSIDSPLAIVRGQLFVRGGSGATYGDFLLAAGGGSREFALINQLSGRYALFVSGGSDADNPTNTRIGIGLTVPVGALHVRAQRIDEAALVLQGITGHVADFVRLLNPAGAAVFRATYEGRLIGPAADPVDVNEYTRKSYVDLRSGVTSVNTRTGAVTGLVESTDPRLSDARAPLPSSVTNASVAGDAAIAQTKIAGLVAALDAKIDDAEKGAANGVATLDAGSKVPAAQIPSVAISDYLGDVASQAAMLALVGQRGDWTNRTDLSASFILIGDDPTLLANWKQLATPADVVSSVNGRTGAVLGLAEETDPRFTDQRTPLDSSVTDAKVAAAAAIAQSKIANLLVDLAAKIAATEKGAASGVATLDAASKVPAVQLPVPIIPVQPDATGIPVGGIYIDSDEVVGETEPTLPETLVSSSALGSSYTVNLARGTFFNLTRTQNVTFSFPLGLDATKLHSFSMLLRQDATGGWTTTFPASVRWGGGAAPALTTTANRGDLLTFLTVDGGTTWLGLLSKADFALDAQANTAPAVPTGLLASAGNAQFTINWADNQEADLHATSPYDYRYSTTNPPDGAPVAVGVSEATVTGLVNGTTYYVQVRARDTAGLVSDWTAAVSIVPTAAVYSTPAFVQRKSAVAANLATVSATLPAALTVGNVIVAVCRWGGTGNTAGPTVEAGAGKTLTRIGAIAAEGTVAQIAVYARVIDGTESTTVTATVTDASTTFVIDAMEWSGLSTTLDGEATVNSAGATVDTLTVGPVTPTISYVLVLGIGGLNTGGTAPAWTVDPSTTGWTQQSETATLRLFSVSKVLTAQEAQSVRLNWGQLHRAVAKMLVIRAKSS